MQYVAIVLHAKEGGFFITFPDFPEAFTQAQSREEIAEMAQEVLSFAVEEYTKARRELPKPTDNVVLWGKRCEFMEQDGVDKNREPMIMLFSAPSVDQTPVRVSVSFPKCVLEEIDAKAASAGMSRSGFLAQAAQQYRA